MTHKRNMPQIFILIQHLFFNFQKQCLLSEGAGMIEDQAAVVKLKKSWEMCYKTKYEQ